MKTPLRSTFTALLLATSPAFAQTPSADGAPDFSALNVQSIAFPGTSFGSITFEPTGVTNYSYTFDNEWLQALPFSTLEAGWIGNVSATLTSGANAGNTNAFMASGNRLTEGNDFNVPGSSNHGSGLFYETIGRGSHFFSNDGDSDTWTFTFDFSGLADGYLPSGTLLSLVDSGEGEESMVLSASIDGGGTGSWLSQADFYTTTPPTQNQPAPTFAGGAGNVYQLSSTSSSDNVPGSGADYVWMTTTENLETVSITVNQGPGGGSHGFKFVAPVETLPIPEPSSALLVLAALLGGVNARRRKSPIDPA